jgi:hypothetical protein
MKPISTDIFPIFSRIISIFHFGGVYTMEQIRAGLAE